MYNYLRKQKALQRKAKIQNTINSVIIALFIFIFGYLSLIGASYLIINL